MSLATRCSSCGTVFRVVQDQLKVSEGWVRCGRCQQVFNAVEGLFDLDREAPPAWAQPSAPELAGAAAPAAQTPARAAPLHVTGAAATERPLLHTDDSVLPEDFADARFPSELGRDADDDAAADAPRAAGLADDDHDAAPATQPPAEALSPQFVRMAEQAQRWERPRTRAALGVAAVALAVLLAGQVSMHFRSELAARWPGTRPVLGSWCAALGCTVEAPMQLQALAVDSSGLVKLEAEGLYRLEIVLRNRAEHAVRVPSIDLTLTDPNGRLVTRRAMSPAEFNAPRSAIAAGGDLPMHALLSSRDARIAGYAIDLFYP